MMRPAPFKQPARSQKMHEKDVWFFEKKTDDEVRECPAFDECVSPCGMGVGAVEDLVQSAMGGKGWHECSCRPTWYLERMAQCDQRH